MGPTGQGRPFSSSPADAFPAGMSPGSSSIGGKSELELLYSRSECDIVSGLKTLPPAHESWGQGRPFSSSPADAFPAGMSPGSSSIGGKSELELLIRIFSDCWGLECFGTPA